MIKLFPTAAEVKRLTVEHRAGVDKHLEKLMDNILFALERGRYQCEIQVDIREDVKRLVPFLNELGYIVEEEVINPGRLLISW